MKAFERPRALRRPRPPMPFDPRMIGGKSRIGDHPERNDNEARQQHLALSPDPLAKEDHRGERNAEVIEVALLKTKRAGLEADHVLEEPGAQDRARAEDRRDRGGRRNRSRAGAIKPG